MYPKLRYEPILAKAADWPIVKMYQDKAVFLEAVTNKAVNDMLASQGPSDSFRLELAQALDNERARLQKLIWQVDRKEDASFWAPILDGLRNESISLSGLLKDISLHYTKEIAGGFNMWHYRLAQAAASYTLNRLLNPVLTRNPRTLTKINADLREQIVMVGAINELRQLTRLGTIVMVPTHCSHFDSVLLWWVIHTLGLPGFMCGAGLNLFNSPFFGYFMNKLGTYKVDRRKKNIAYLTTLKAYSSMMLHWGCHSMFYPGGTRSRSGALENTLKLGLLSTAIDAQQINYQLRGPQGRKLFIVPVVFNYHFVLEAPLLIRDYLASQGEYVCKKDKKLLHNSYKLLKLIKTFATKSSTIMVSISRPMDVLGNPVDMAGQSYDARGFVLDLYKVLMDSSQPEYEGAQKNKKYVKELSQRILDAYRQDQCVLSSTLLAFTAFGLIKRNYPDIPPKALFMSGGKWVILYADLEKALENVRQGVLQLAAQLKIRVSDFVKQGTTQAIIQDGLANLGLYHPQLPLVKNKEGNIVVNDMCNLFFYHNRLTGYGLEKCLA